jgi:oxalate decarboxylase
MLRLRRVTLLQMLRLLLVAHLILLLLLFIRVLLLGALIFPFLLPLVIVKPGGMRERRWHPNASEWQFYIAGKARMTVFFPVDNVRTMDFNANDVGYIPLNAPHYIENTGDTDLVFLETFSTDEFMDVSLNQWLRRVPSEMLKAHLNIDRETALKIPAEKLEVI